MESSKHTQNAIELLKRLIQIPSLSRQEDKTADRIATFLQVQGVSIERQGNNVWAHNKAFSAGKPTILLNSHHDTVRAKEDWTRDPHEPSVEGDTLYGLGSNDAGGPLVSLIACFLHYYERTDLPFNLIMAATAEEEISGANGIASILPLLGTIDLGIVGEPTQMQLAIAEKGLMVLDCFAKGKSGHAARNEGVNAIYEAMPDIHWFQSYQFDSVSDFLGPVKMSVTLGRETYGSPTLSDQALMPFPTLKIGPGDSARSHTANEYILLSEIEAGITLYIQLLDGLVI